MKKVSLNADQRVTLKKRRRGILKKAIELSKRCDQEIMLVILDKRENRLIEYMSDDHLTIKYWLGLDPGITESYTNDDYDLIKEDIYGKIINRRQT